MQDFQAFGKLANFFLFGKSKHFYRHQINCTKSGRADMSWTEMYTVPKLRFEIRCILWGHLIDTLGSKLRQNTTDSQTGWTKNH